jgi:hypothetical protein
MLVPGDVGELFKIAAASLSNSRFIALELSATLARRTFPVHAPATVLEP